MKKGKWIVGIIIVIVIFAAIAGGGDDKEKSEQASTTTSESGDSSGDKTNPEEEPEKTEAPIKYKSVTANKLSDALDKNALKAQKDQKDQYLKVSGKLGTIDSSGNYIVIDSDKDFDLTSIRCHLKSDKQKNKVAEMEKGDKIVVKGKCKDVGEIIGYSIDTDDITKK